MEFFHAKIDWNGVGKVVAYVLEIPSSDNGKCLFGIEDGIVGIILKETEVSKLRHYLDNMFRVTVKDEEFETYLRKVFYIETHVASWFDLKKFMQICNQLQVDPIMSFYQYRLVQSDGNR